MVISRAEGAASLAGVQRPDLAGLLDGDRMTGDGGGELGEEFGMTVVGFLRDGGFTVYCGEGRIEGLS